MSKLTEDILSTVDIVDVAGKYISLKRAGTNFTACCPFHNEKTPSFVISPSKQIFKCFGCGKGGNALTFIQEYEKVDFRDAIKILADQAHIDLSKYENTIKASQEFTDEREKIKRIHKLTQQFFVQELQKSDTALAYLKDNRKLTPQEIELFEIGYAPDSHYNLIQFLRSKGFSDQDMLQSSIAKTGKTGDLFSFFRKRITFPIFDTMHNIIGFSARVLDPIDTPKYLNSSEHPAFEKSKVLYGLNRAKQHITNLGCLIVVEGQMDVVGLQRLHYPVGVATCGTALTSSHLKTIKRYTENLMLLFDQDKAGQQATIKALGIAYENDIFPKIIRLPENAKDADDLANLPDGKELRKQAVEQAEDGFAATIDTLHTTHDSNSPVEKQKMLNMLFGLVFRINSVPLQDHYLHMIADKTHIQYEFIRPQYIQYAKTEGKTINRQAPAAPVNYQPERELLGASLFYKNFLNQFIEDDSVRDALTGLQESIKKRAPELPFIQLQSNPNEEEQEKLTELQLRWEREFADKDELKKYALAKQTLNIVYQGCLQHMLKQANISHEQKQALLDLARKLGR